MAFSNLSSEQKELKLSYCAEQASKLALHSTSLKILESINSAIEKLRTNQEKTFKSPKEAFECKDCGKIEWLDWITCDLDGCRICSSCVVKNEKNARLFCCRKCAESNHTV